jgi:hypothetical protein
VLSLSLSLSLAALPLPALAAGKGGFQSSDLPSRAVGSFPGYDEYERTRFWADPKNWAR